MNKGNSPVLARPGNLPSVLDVTFQQIHNASLAIQAVAPFLFLDTRQREFGEKGQKDPGNEVTDSAIVTFMKACSVLDNLLDDKARWTSERYTGLESALENTYRRQAELLEAQRTLAETQAEAVAMATRPSMLLKPKLTQKKDGTFVARHEIVKGEGKTIADALVAFDMAYFGLMDETQQPPPEQ